MKDISIRYTEPEKPTALNRQPGDPSVVYTSRTVTMKGTGLNQRSNLAMVLYDVEIKNGSSIDASFDHLQGIYNPTVTVNSIPKSCYIEAKSITNECIDLQDKVINIPLKAFDGKQLIAYKQSQTGQINYLILFQSHTDNNRVHAIRLEVHYNPVMNEHSVRAWFPNEKLRNQDEWTIQVPSELKYYIENHIQSLGVQQVGTSAHSIMGGHRGYNSVPWMNNTPITIKRTGKGSKHLY